MSKFKDKLPYALDALEPHISEEQLTLHYEKHYGGYCDNLEKLIKDTAYQNMNLTQIVDKTQPPPLRHASDPIYNNAAQIKNHIFFFQQLNPSPGEISDSLKTAIERDYKSFDHLMEVITSQVTSFFGAGWIWLTIVQHKEWDSPSLQVITTRDGNTIAHDETTDFTLYHPICVIDVWEHSYYVDHRNDRTAYVEAISNVLDWKKISDRYDAHLSDRFDYTKSFEL